MQHKIAMTKSEDTQARHHIALLGEETNQQLSLRVQDIVPGQGTPLHAHVEQAETFHVVAGTFRFQVGEEVVIGRPGFSVHIPKGTPHCFLYEGKEDNGQLISILTPGIHDGFIRNIPEAEQQGAPMSELSAMAETFGAKILGPGLKAVSE